MTLMALKWISEEFNVSMTDIKFQRDLIQCTLGLLGKYLTVIVTQDPSAEQQEVKSGNGFFVTPGRVFVMKGQDLDSVISEIQGRYPLTKYIFQVEDRSPVLCYTNLIEDFRKIENYNLGMLRIL